MKSRVSLKNTLSFSYFLERSEENLLSDAFLFFLSMVFLFLLVQVMLFQILSQLSQYPLFSIPSKTFFTSSLFFILVPVFFGGFLTLIAFPSNPHLYVENYEKLETDWFFENPDVSFKKSFTLDLLFGMVLSPLMGSALFTFSFPFSLILSVFFLFFLAGLGLNYFSATLFAVYASWIIVPLSLIQILHKILEKRNKSSEPVQPPILISNRVKSIIKSGEAPIVCQSCSSFVPATQENCMVCGAPLR